MRTFAKYALRECIGRGGLAEVWRVADPDGRPFALKILSVEAAGPSPALLRHEFDLLAPLHHPNIIDVVEVVEDEGRVGLVLELCAGSLADVVRRRGPLPPRVVCSVGRQIAAALAAAHAAGIVHRDVKPANVLVTADERVKLTDFGIASLLDEPGARTEQSALWGTLPFLAPERRHGGRGTKAADLYGLASTLAWLATGRMVGDLYVKPVLDVLRRELPAPLVEILERAGRYDPEERYASANEIATALAAIEQSLPAAHYTLLDEAPRSALDTRAPRASSSPPPPQRGSDVRRDEAQRPLRTGRVLSASGGAILLVVAVSLVWSGRLGSNVGVVQSPADSTQASSHPNPEVASDLAPAQPPPLELSDLARCDDAPSTYRNIVRVGPKETIGLLTTDLDGDGWIDAVFTNQLDESLTIYWGGEDRILQDPVRYPIRRSNAAAAAADLDGDGDLDLITNHLDASLIAFHRNEGDRTFVLIKELQQAPPSTATQAIDWNEDGHLDLLMSLRDDGHCTALRLGTGEPFEFRGYECIGVYLHLNQAIDPTRKVIVRTTPEQTLVQHRRGVANGLTGGTPVLPTNANFAVRGAAALADTHPTPGYELYVHVSNGRDTALLRIDTTGRICRQTPMNLTLSEQATNFTDLDRDGTIDNLWSVTCSYCDSNHTAALGVRE
jgi:serine/threonine-protein kinase